MKIISNKVKPVYRYNNENYVASDRKEFHVGDIFFDSRDYEFKAIESDKDIVDVWCVAPEIYTIMEKVDNND